jgi:hypothetical protein
MREKNMCKPENGCGARFWYLWSKLLGSQTRAMCLVFTVAGLRLLFDAVERAGQLQNVHVILLAVIAAIDLLFLGLVKINPVNISYEKK